MNDVTPPPEMVERSRQPASSPKPEAGRPHHSGDRLAAHRAYWRQQLGDELPVLALPLEHPRSALHRFSGASWPIALPADLVRELLRLSQREGATPYMLLLAAFQVLLYRYSGQEEILVASPAAGHPAEAPTNTLVLRGNLLGSPTFRALLARTREVTLAAHAHRSLPFEQVVELVDAARDPSHPPLAQAHFALHDGSKPPARPSVAFDLSLALHLHAGTLTGEVEYNAALFDAPAIARLAANFAALLAAIVAEPDGPIAALPLLAPAERHTLLVEWNQTARPYDSAQTLHGLVAAQVTRTPAATALVWGKEQLSYQELDERANVLAHRLRALGVGPEVRVALCLPRSTEMVVALLAILKAGGTYLPLDPAYPPARLAYMLQDGGAAVLLVHSTLLPELPEHGVTLLCVDGTDERRPDSPIHDGLVATPDNLAYVIYTSGSTGLPKGVAIPHRAVVALLAWAHDLFSAAEIAGVLAATSICFDLSVFELFVPLTRGGTVILADDVLALPTLPARDSVTLINTVPSAIAGLLRSGGIPRGVRTINLAGEPLSSPLTQQLYRLGSVERVYDLYGPSEDTTYSTCALRRPDGPATIGRPLPNSQLYLLDRQLQPVPLGAVGELFLAGDGLARGYLGRPALTAERFIPNPFSREAGARLYRTGDLARYLPDGNLLFLGRSDHQIKLRGFRIELGEIEARLRRYPAVREAVVIAREDAILGKSLVAYIVPPPTAPVEKRPLLVSQLPAFIRERLPDYMVPAAFVILDALPLTPNGKLDRAALPDPDFTRRSREGEALPRTPTEAQLMDIWASVLGLERVDIHVGFFQLGGHSLLATQVLSRIREAFGVELSQRAFFDVPTIAQLGTLVDKKRAEEEAVAELLAHLQHLSESEIQALLD